MMIIRTSFPLVFALIPALVGYLGGWLKWRDYISEDLGAVIGDEGYDFVVVGGGSAGCVVTARLSENPLHRILLLAAGGNPNPLTFIPLTTAVLQNHPATDWEYKTVPLNNSGFPLPHQSLPWPRGKMLGGSSATNFMIYMRGNPKDFDRWANISGDSRWSYSNVIQYFKKMENYSGIYKNDTKWHGKNGPLTVESVDFAPGLKEVLEAVNEWGYKILDLNAEQEEGFSSLDATQNRGRRASSYSAYIEPILGRTNLSILRYSHVTKIHFDSELKAVGVYFARNGVTFYVPVRKEVIVSSGTINSAQLLMLSGIGPSEHLKSVGIQPLVNLPMGRNLADHSMTVVGPFILNRAESLMLPRDVSLKSLVDFQANGQGPLTSPMGLMGIGVTSTSSSPGWPNLLHLIDSMGIFDGFGPNIDGMFGSGSHYTNLVQNFSGLDAHSVLLTLGKPKSRGFIELRDSNPFSKPIIDPQYYSDEKNQDMLDMIEGYELIVNLYEQSKALGRKLGARLIEVPSCAKYGVKSRAYYECAIRTPILHLFHPVETCHMEKIGSPNAVVDSQLRVIGTKGLRVIDASVMPEITNANTNAPTIMIAEVGSDLIKRSYSSGYSTNL